MRVATPTLRAVPLLHALRGEAALARASTELTTGRLADPGLALGAATGRLAALDAAVADLTAARAANGVARTGLDAMQASLAGMREAADTLTANLLTAATAGTDPARALVAESAAGLLSSVVGHANVTVAGTHLFGGERSGTAPVADPATDPIARATVHDAFVAAFGHPIDDPATASIDAEAMGSFLRALEGNFETIWSVRWGGAPPAERLVRSEPGAVMRVPVTHHDPGLRELVLATLIAERFADAPLGEAARDAALDRAAHLAGSAVARLDEASGRLGVVAERLERSDRAMAAREAVVAQAWGGMVGVDPTEAAARVQALATEVETSLAVTARVSRLSLLNYL